MKRIIIGLAFLLTCGIQTSSAAVKVADVKRHDTPSFIGYVPNAIVVQFAPFVVGALDKTSIARGKTGIFDLDQLGRKYNAVSVRPQFPIAKPKILKGRVIDLSGWYKIKFSHSVNIEAVVNEYTASPNVIDAQPIGIHATYATPNDDSFINQWHMNQGSDHDIDGPEAWDAQTGDENLIVAILDTGVRYFHKDLGGSGASYSNPTNIDGNMWINWAEKNGASGIDDDNNGYTDDWIGWDFVDGASQCWSGEDCNVQDNDPRDFNGHGTHCAGNVAAITNNGYATTGPAGGWGNGTLQSSANGVKVMTLRVGWSGRYRSFEVGYVRMDFAAEAFYYAADNGAKIASCSWGSSNTGGLGAAIDYFLTSGGLIFKAAGNENDSSADYMGGRTDVISVAATDQNDCKADFSNYGAWVDISAPGVEIWSLYHDHEDPSSDYVASTDGTSMATPLAAGVAALIWSQNPSLTASQVEQKLLDTADMIDNLPCNSLYTGELGSGRINAYQAIFIDSDGDGVPDWSDECPNDPNKSAPGVCGCGVLDIDSDGDALFDCEENSYGTDPGIVDTDNDGIDDGDEYDYWGDNWNTNYDGDGIMNNLLDSDADGDGYLDGDEINSGYNPADPNNHPATPIPTVSEWGMIILFVLLVGSALWIMRKRKRQESM